MSDLTPTFETQLMPQVSVLDSYPIPDIRSPLYTQFHKFLPQALIHSTTAISSFQLTYKFLLQGPYTNN